jgi:glycopeptide antibiotics resistance protein
MQRRSSIQTSSLIILLSIITILLQFLTYYFFEAAYVIWGISCLVSVICCHILLEQTSTYESCFYYSFLNIFFSLIIIAITYFGKVTTFLPYTDAMLGIALINWLIPMVHCFLRYMTDYGTRVDDFILYYRNSNIVFFISYLAVIFYGVFAKDAFPWAYRAISETANFIPFRIIAAQIEDYLYGLIPLSDIFTYLLGRILAFLPYGFYITMILRKQGRLPRFFALLLLPFLFEILQYFIIPERCDIDDLIYALIGGLIGAFLFFLQNILFRAISGKEFLGREGEYRFSSNSLHF